MIGSPGTLIGVFADVHLTPEVTLLAPGDTLILYTDGVTDVRPPHDLDDDSLITLVQASAAGSGDAATITLKLLDGIEAVLPISRRTDDLALLVIRIDLKYPGVHVRGVSLDSSTRSVDFSRTCR